MSQTRFFALRGGMDLVTPPIEAMPGRAIAGVNYEPVQRGYRRVDGYERFSGRPRPSDASYWVARFTTGDQAFADLDTVTGATSGATARVVRGSVIETGAYVSGDAAGTVILTNIIGTFQDGEDLEVGAARYAALDGLPVEGGADNDEDDKAWLQTAIEMARSQIAAVPGSGPVRGVWMLKGRVYAFRDDLAGTAGAMHQATETGWQPVALGRELAFSAGTAEFLEGETVTGGTSGATGVVQRVVLQSGAWSNTDAAGRLIFAAITGAFQAGEAITSASGAATTAGVDAAITLPPGGRYHFETHNFFGSADLVEMYGVNGVGAGFAFDGDNFIPIYTGMADDRPIRVTVHSNHLFFGYPGGSVQHSSLGAPFQWQVLTGAGEIGIGEELTGLMGDVYGVLFIMGRQKIAVLVGDDAENWVQRTLTTDSGGEPYSAQKMASPVYLDAIGVRALDTTERFGDFAMGTLTQAVEPLFAAKRKTGATVVASTRVRAKDHYRLYWDDGTGLTLYFGRGAVEVMPFVIEHVPTCMAEGKDTNGRDRVFFGDANGFVYEVDAGTSFDGQRVDAFIRLPFNHVGSPAQRKRWMKAVLELDSAPDTSLGLIPEFGYADADHPPGQETGFIRENFLVKGSGGFWEEDNFDQFYWSSAVEGQAEAHIDGLGRNMSMVVVSSSTYEAPHTLTGMLLHFSYRGVAR